MKSLPRPRLSAAPHVSVRVAGWAAELDTGLRRYDGVSAGRVAHRMPGPVTPAQAGVQKRRPLAAPAGSPHAELDTGLRQYDGVSAGRGAHRMPWPSSPAQAGSRAHAWEHRGAHSGGAPMNGLSFELAPSAPTPDPNRVDIACFTGYVARRATPLPVAVRAALAEARWTDGPYARPQPELEALLRLPVVVELGRVRCAVCLGCATGGGGRANLRQLPRRGGAQLLCQRRTARGDRALRRSLALSRACRDARQRSARLAALLAPDASPMDLSSWLGIAPCRACRVALLCLPDLPISAPPSRRWSTSPSSRRLPRSLRRVLRQHRCGGGRMSDCATSRRRAPTTPASSPGAMRWAARARLASRHRELLLLAALPLPMPGARNADNWAQADFHAYPENAGVLAAPDSSNGGRAAASAFVQLAWPWLKTRHSADLPGTLEAPDGLLAGLLAINALAAAPSARWPAAGSRRCRAASRCSPGAALPRPSDRLAQRVCVIAPSVDGWTLHSDVTASADEAWRAGGVSRLMGAVLRAARRTGEAAVFEASGPALWQRVTRSMEQLLSAFWREGGSAVPRPTRPSACAAIAAP